MSVPNPTFWLGKRVLVTGSTGFKGAWLCTWLNMLGSDVLGIGLPAASSPALFNLIGGDERFHTHYCDIRNLNKFRDQISNFQPEIVFHLAAQPLVQRSYIRPVETLQTNIIGTVNLLEASLCCSAGTVVVNVTSDKCYENNGEGQIFSEDSMLGGADPYSCSKACSELITKAYQQSFYKSAGILASTARAGNVLGGGDWSEGRLVPDVLRSHEAQQSVVLRNPGAVRPWQHVLEPLRGYMLLAESLASGKVPSGSAWNFGPNKEEARDVGWLVHRLLTHLKSNLPPVIDTNCYPPEARFLSLDSTKSRVHLNWKPLWNAETTLKKVADWYVAYKAGKPVLAECQAQIEEYTAANQVPLEAG